MRSVLNSDIRLSKRPSFSFGIHGAVTFPFLSGICTKILMLFLNVFLCFQVMVHFILHYLIYIVQLLDKIIQKR